jgi:hypothetical protein
MVETEGQGMEMEDLITMEIPVATEAAAMEVAIETT